MKIKRILAVLISLIIMLSLAACGGSSDTAEADDQSTQETTAETDDAETTETTASGDILIIYFSAANRTDVDTVTKATPMGDAGGTTGWMAEIIQSEVGGDIAKLTPSADYPVGYDETADQAKQESDSGARPDYLPLDVDPADYDTIFIGYPIWWYEMPMVVEKFFDDYDLSGKTIIPFNTHEGSGDGGTYSTIREREPDATVLDGLAIRGGNAGEDSAGQEIQEWLLGLNLE